MFANSLSTLVIISALLARVNGDDRSGDSSLARRAVTTPGTPGAPIVPGAPVRRPTISREAAAPGHQPQQLPHAPPAHSNLAAGSPLGLAQQPSQPHSAQSPIVPVHGLQKSPTINVNQPHGVGGGAPPPGSPLQKRPTIPIARPAHGAPTQQHGQPQSQRPNGGRGAPNRTPSGNTPSRRKLKRTCPAPWETGSRKKPTGAPGVPHTILDRHPGAAPAHGQLTTSGGQRPAAGAAAQRPTRPPVNTAAHGAARAPGLHSPRTGQPPASPLRSVSHTPGGATPQSHPPTSLTAPRNVAHPVAARMLFKRNPGCDATWRYNGVDYPCQLQDAGSGGAQVCIALDANGDIIFVLKRPVGGNSADVTGLRAAGGLHGYDAATQTMAYAFIDGTPIDETYGYASGRGSTYEACMAWFAQRKQFALDYQIGLVTQNGVWQGDSSWGNFHWDDYAISLNGVLDFGRSRLVPSRQWTNAMQREFDTTWDADAHFLCEDLPRAAPATQG